MRNTESMWHLDKHAAEDGETSCHAVPPKFKRRKVSAVRDFPPGCGKNAPQINMGLKETTVAVLGSNEKVCDALEVAAAQALENVVDSPSTKVLVCAASMDVHCLSSNVEKETKAMVLIDGMEEKELVDSKCLGVELPMALDNVGFIKPLKELGYNNSEPSSDAQQVACLDAGKSVDGLEAVTLTDNVVLPHSQKSWSPPKWPVAVANVEKSVPRNYPPRRRTSAIRDFPPFCGRNAPLLPKEEYPKASASHENIISGKGKFVVEQKFKAETVGIDVKKNEKNATVGDCARSKLGRIVSKEIKDRAQAESKRPAVVKLKMQTAREISKTGMKQEETRGKNAKPLQDSKFYQPTELSQVVNMESFTNVRDVDRKGKEIVLSKKDKSYKRKFSGISGSCSQLQLKAPTGMEDPLERVIVLGLMAAPYCPWRQGKRAIKSDLRSGVSGRKRKIHDFTETKKSPSVSRTRNNEAESSGGRYLKVRPPSTEMAASQVTRQLVVADAKSSSEDDEKREDFQLVQKSHNLDVSLPPFGVSSSSGRGGDNDAAVSRNKVRETLRLFQAICRKLLHEEEGKPKKEKNGARRVDLHAARILKDKGKYVNSGEPILGPVPGVEVGDEFQYRVELAIIGVHRLFQGGIDTILHKGKRLASSIVASGGYADDLDNSDILIYSGSGGNVMNADKEPEDQKLERGNLALKNSIHEKSPVRVIRGIKESKSCDSDSKTKMVTTYIYDGLYLVQKYWQEIGQHGKLVFKFQLNRIPGQPELAWKVVKNSKKFKVREGLCVDDISQGRELMPICAVNTLDNEKPPPFEYSVSMIYPAWYHSTPPKGCDCIDGCSDSGRCSCAVKNGGEIPYNCDGAIVEAKPLIYECGPSCKCPPSCHNRVSQYGIKFQLEIFKTDSRGWGVRSLNSIPSGSFICEYTGELLEEKEAEQRTGNDEYLFDIGYNYNDHSLWNGLSALMPDAQSGRCEIVEDGGFTIDAAVFGNVGRFINHSCSPNLYAQNVLYDHEDKKMPHIMLFSAENIPPLQELTYHYNYVIDQVRDSSGNIKKKSCYCGSSECTGRMY